MTYGWALLVVLIAISALAYFGLLNPDKFLPDKVTVSDNRISIIASGSNKLLIKNNGDTTLYNFWINFTTCNGEITPEYNLTPDKIQSVNILCKDVPDKNRKLKTNADIYYRTKTYGNWLDHKAYLDYSVTGNYYSTNELRAYWPFDTDFKDYSGNGKDGTAQDGARIFDNHLELDGDLDYVDVPFFGAIATRVQSLSFWIKPSDNAGYERILGSDTDSDSCYSIYIYTDRKLISRQDDNGGYNQASSELVSENEWKHFVIVYDEDNDETHMYVNGELDNTINPSDQRIEFTSLGVFPNDGDYELNFNGSMDEVMAFDRVLSPSEVKSIYESQIR